MAADHRAERYTCSQKGDMEATISMNRTNCQLSIDMNELQVRIVSKLSVAN